MKRMHDDKELIDLLQEEGFLEEVKVENIDSDNATQGEVLMADGSGGAEWSEIEAGMENPMTAKDDLIIGGTDGAPARLAKGTNGQVLQVGSDGLEWATPSGGGSYSDILELDFNNGNATSLTDTQYDDIRSGKIKILKINNAGVSDYNGTFFIDRFYYHSTLQRWFYACYKTTDNINDTSRVSSSNQWYGASKIYYGYQFAVYNTKTIATVSGSDYCPQIIKYDINQSKFDALYCQKNAPDTDGTYVLKCTVVSGVKTYTWVSE